MNFVLIYLDGVYQCIVLSTRRTKFQIEAANNEFTISMTNDVCPLCGKKKSLSAQYCRQCHAEVNTRKPDKTTLANLLKENNYSKIGRLYGVSGNAVKKWAKSYGLYEFQFHKTPQKSALESELKLYSKSDVAKKNNVCIDTIRKWEKELSIDINPKRVKCIETQQVFYNKTEAARQLYPNLNSHFASNAISKACDTKKDFHGYHWCRI